MVVWLERYAIKLSYQFWRIFHHFLIDKINNNNYFTRVYVREVTKRSQTCASSSGWSLWNVITSLQTQLSCSKYFTPHDLNPLWFVGRKFNLRKHTPMKASSIGIIGNSFIASKIYRYNCLSMRMHHKVIYPCSHNGAHNKSTTGNVGRIVFFWPKVCRNIILTSLVRDPWRRIKNGSNK